MQRPIDLPDFKQPPLSEVVLSLQFDPLDSLKAPLIGVLWNRFRKSLPEIEEHPPLPAVINHLRTTSSTRSICRQSGVSFLAAFSPAQTSNVAFVPNPFSLRNLRLLILCEAE